MHRFLAVSLAVGGVTIALAGAGGARPSISRTQAISFAQAVNLNASDLPGAKVAEEFPQPPGSKRSPGKTSEELEGTLRCKRHGEPSREHRTTHKRSVYAQSAILESQYGVVGSEVGVMPSAAVAKTEIAPLLSHRGHACFAKELGEALTSTGTATITSFAVTATFVPVAKLLGPRAVLVHVLAAVPRPKSPYHLHIDGALFQVGAADIQFLTLGSRQFPTAIELRLLSLLRTRAEANQL